MTAFQPPDPPQDPAAPEPGEPACPPNEQAAEAQEAADLAQEQTTGVPVERPANPALGGEAFERP